MNNRRLNMDNFLAQLKAERKAQQLTLEQISEELRIQVAYLQALEEGDYGRLPELVYSIGFIRSYAKLLGIDSKGMIEHFKLASIVDNSESVRDDLHRSELSNLCYENMSRCGKNHPMCRVGNLVSSHVHDKFHSFCYVACFFLLTMAIAAVTLVVLKLE
jgi:transcriptional regulator with XRE-family HTH domain